jgi:beta-lactamase regulating signal transducer with metallopeptidase domain
MFTLAQQQTVIAPGDVSQAVPYYIIGVVILVFVVIGIRRQKLNRRIKQLRKNAAELNEKMKRSAWRR